MSDKRKNILYVEDDETLSYITKDNLEMHGFSVIHCTDGIDAIEKFQAQNISICLLDVMLPKLDGFSVAKEIRKTNPDVPIIFLTARSLKEDKIEGLKLGADDYIVKPFSIEELILKIGIFLKRSKIYPENTFSNSIKLGLFTFIKSNQSLFSGTEEIQLTQRESELLALLIENINQVLKKDEILKRVWFDNNSVFSRSLDVFISRLRKILEPDPTIQIENIHGVGYRLKQRN
jgi:DNA-binding response OmpR family regulator